MAAEYQRERRIRKLAGETPEESVARRKADIERTKKNIERRKATETPEQAAERRAKVTKIARLRRELIKTTRETPEQKAARFVRQNEQFRRRRQKKLSTETSEQAAVRRTLETEKRNKRIKRKQATETLEEAAARRAKAAAKRKIRAETKRANETPEERTARLLMQSERRRERRKQRLDADVSIKQLGTFTMIGHDHYQWEVDVDDCTTHVIQPRQIIGVSLKKAPKTNAERNREYRARKALRKQRSDQQHQRDFIDEISTEYVQSAGPSKMNVIARRTKYAEQPKVNAIARRTKSAEATRRWREKKRGVSDSELLKKQAKTPAQRMREYRERKKLAKKILLKEQCEQQNSDSIDNALERGENERAGPSGFSTSAKRIRRGSEQTKSRLPHPRNRAKTAAERMQEYRERREKNINIESDNQSATDETSNVGILFRHVREGDIGQSSVGDICSAHWVSEDGTNVITNPAAVALKDGDTSISGSCTWSSFEPSSYSITTTKGSFNIRTTNEPVQQSLNKSVLIKDEPFQDSWPLCEASGSSSVPKETFQDNRDFDSLNDKAQYCNQSVKAEPVSKFPQTIFDVKVKRDEHLIYGEYIADRFRKCKRNDTEVNVAKNHIESTLLDLYAGANSYKNSVSGNQINLVRSDEAPSLLTQDRVTPVVQAIIVKEEIDL